MASAEEILNSEDYKNANLETKRAIFVKHIAKTPDYADANKETQEAIMQRFGIAEPSEPAEKPASAAPVEREQPRNEGEALSYGAAGAGLGFGSSFLPKVTGTTEAQVERAKERLMAAMDRFKEAQNAADRGPASGYSIAEIRDAQNAARAEVEAARNELVALSQSLKEASKAAPVAISEAAEALPSRTVPGASGAQNWARAMATQDLPESLIDQVTTMRKTGEGGAQRLIDLDLEKLKKIQELGEGEHRLAGQGKGQLMLPPDEAARLEAQLAERQAAQAAEQARMAEIAERERLLRESELKGKQQAAKGRAKEAGERVRHLGEIQKETARLERGVEKAGSGVRLAEEAAKRAEAAKLTPTQRLGSMIGGSKMLGTALGGLGAAGTYLSIDEAIRRYNAGDYSGMVIPTLEAAFGAMSLMPAWNPITAGIKGVGTLGSMGLGALELGKYMHNKMKD